MGRRIPRAFINKVNRHERALRQMSTSTRPGAVFKRNNQLVGGALGKILKDIVGVIASGKLPEILTGLSGNFIKVLRRFAESRRPIEQGGSGIFTVLKHVIPLVLSVLPGLFRKKK